MKFLFFFLFCFTIFLSTGLKINAVENPASGNIGFTIKTAEVAVQNFRLSKTDYKAGETVTGSFTLRNTTGNSISNVRYKILLLGDYKNNTPQKQYDYSKMYGPIFIAGKEKKVVNFTYKIPESISGKNLGIQVHAMYENEMSMGWANAMINVTGGTGMATVKSASVSVNGKDFGLEAGPTIYSSQKAALNITLENNTDNKIILTPSINIHKRPEPDKIISTFSDKTISIEPGAEAKASIDLPTFNYEPQVYVGDISFLDSNKVMQASNLQFRYIIGGDVVTINSVSSDKSNVADGETFNVTVNYSGSPQDIITGQVYGSGTSDLNIKIFNQNNKLVADYSDKIDFNKGSSKSISIKSPVNALALRSEITVLKDGKTLASVNSPLSSDYAQKVGKTDMRDYFSLKNIIAILAILILILGIIFRKKLLERKLLLVIVIIILIVLIGTFFFITIVKAGGTGPGGPGGAMCSEYTLPLPPGWSCVVSQSQTGTCYPLDPDAVTITINAPADGEIINCGPITIEATIQTTACSNESNAQICIGPDATSIAYSWSSYCVSVDTTPPIPPPTINQQSWSYTVPYNIGQSYTVGIPFSARYHAIYSGAQNCVLDITADFLRFYDVYCVPTFCGDGKVNGTEECDTGTFPGAYGDGCLSSYQCIDDCTCQAFPYGDPQCGSAATSGETDPPPDGWHTLWPYTGASNTFTGSELCTVGEPGRFDDGTWGDGWVPISETTLGSAANATDWWQCMVDDGGWAPAMPVCTATRGTAVKPTVTCEANPTSGNIPLAVTFTATPSGGTGGPYTYLWTIPQNGGGYHPPSWCTSSICNDTYTSPITYPQAGLTVKDKAGTISLPAYCDPVKATVGHGQCGTSNQEQFDSIPTEPTNNLCAYTTAGSTPVVPSIGLGPWTWDCKGNNNASPNDDVSCSAAQNGLCGTAKGVPSVLAPDANLCANGQMNSGVMIDHSGVWSWTCWGSTGVSRLDPPFVGDTPYGNPINCSAPRIINGYCGGAATSGIPAPLSPHIPYTWTGIAGGTNLPESPYTLCASPAVAIPSTPNLPATGGSETSWECPGSSGGTTATCTAIRAAPLGVCGTSNQGKFDSIPADNLCAYTSAGSTPVSGTGPWTWDCKGDDLSGTADDVSCSAAKNGLCGEANGVPSVLAPADNLCAYTSNGSTPVYPDPWRWACYGSIDMARNPPFVGDTPHGTSVNCSAPVIIVGQCPDPIVYPSSYKTCKSGTLGDYNKYTDHWDWYCMGSNNSISTDDVLCTIPINGKCGSANRIYEDGTTTFIPYVFCNPGTATPKAPDTAATGIRFPSATSSPTPYQNNWTCVGVNTTLNCTALVKVNGVCNSTTIGSYTSTPLEAFPRSGGALCSTGTASAVSPVGGPTPSTPATWTCAGFNTGSTASCTATRAAPSVDGVCGGADSFKVGGHGLYLWTNSTTPIPIAPETLCSSPTQPTPPADLGANGGSETTWICQGSGGSLVNANCKAKRVPTVTGTCGTAAKNYLSTDLAFVGTMCGLGNGVTDPASPVFPVAGSSTTWTCGGSNGGNSSPTCTATRAYQTLTATCGGSPTPTQTGVEVTWTAVPIGGAEPYTYDWSGTDNLGLGEHTISVKKTYTTPGAPPWNTKGAKVIVTSGDGQTAPDANCSVRVSPAVAATCHASPSSTQIGVQVTWTVVASGGNSTYTYSDWSGDDGLTGAGTTTTKTYDTPGTKHANITVESNGYDTNPTPTTCSVNIYQNGACGGAATPPSGTRSLYLYDGDPLGTNLPYPLVQTLCASPAPADPLVPNLPMNYGSQTQWTCPGTGTGSTSVICYARREAITIGTCGVASYYDAGRTYPATETFDNTDGNLCETGHFDGATRPTLPFTPPQTISWTCSGSTACTATRIANPTGSCGEASNYGDVAGRTYVQGEPFPTEDIKLCLTGSYGATKPSLSQDPQTIRWWCSGSEACIAIRSPALVGTCGSAGNMIPPSAGPKIYQQRDSFHNTNGDLCATGQFDGGTRPNLGPPPSEISWTCSGSASCEAKRIADPICGNGIKEGEEPCDTGTFPGPKCTNPLGCTDGCKFNAHCDKIGGICCCAKATLSK